MALTKEYKMEQVKTVVVNGDTSGTIDESTVDFNLEAFIGEEVTYQTRDENGNPYEATGILTEILD